MSASCVCSQNCEIIVIVFSRSGVCVSLGPPESRPFAMEPVNHHTFTFFVVFSPVYVSYVLINVCAKFGCVSCTGGVGVWV